MSAMDGPIQAMKAGLVSLLESGQYSDLTIVCGRYRVKVHQAILRTQSDYFQTKKAFTENGTKLIRLRSVDPSNGGDDVAYNDPEAVKHMIGFFSSLDYKADLPDKDIRELRDIVADTWTTHEALLSKPDIKKVVTNINGLAFELLRMSKGLPAATDSQQCVSCNETIEGEIGCDCGSVCEDCDVQNCPNCC
ncbi:hypothetical protein LTR37_004045 [Vermiconidia calcicola]|uniref:Uncharacterized protein n=1 Tax=Vermiconidia calcicola TaxID=1690605 RepID=A0ACC3NNB3_9PEZI|nr:hypothetical protein LTR37_004045 [Vermiconidia calcicola]